MRLFAPKLPVSPDEREWIDERIAWLADAFAEEIPSRLPQPIVLPTNEYFPDDYDGTEAMLYPLFRRVCGYMGVAPESVRLTVRPDPTEKFRGSPNEPKPMEQKHAAGRYRKNEESGLYEISILASSIRDPMIAIAVIAHELGHVRLLGEERLTHDEPDHEPLTDLLTVYMGMGLFSAGAAFRFKQHDDGQWHGWSARRLGYLPETMYGYALARYTLQRGDRAPVWTRHLSVNVSAYFQQSLRYLMREQARAR
jgi:hypothetical protein